MVNATGTHCMALRASDDMMRATGYSAFRATIDAETWFPIEITYADNDGEPLKTVRIVDQARIGEAWTAMHFVVENLQTGHSTTVQLDDMRFVPDLDMTLLSPEALPDGGRGLQ